jgi:hypothetical protein
VAERIVAGRIVVDRALERLVGVHHRLVGVLHRLEEVLRMLELPLEEHRMLVILEHHMLVEY